MNASPPVHGSCIAWQGRGVLILGAPGSGKSTLALECIDQGAELVADDAVLLSSKSGEVFAAAPENLQGCLALRGLGILRYPPRSEAPLSLVIQLETTNLVMRTETQLHDRMVATLRLPHFYFGRMALVRQALIAATHGPVSWLQDDWIPQRVSA